MAKKNIFLTLLAILLSLPIVSFAQDITITGMIDNVVLIIWYVADAIIVILWIITGILFLTAQGAPEKLNLAKKALFASIIGTAIIIIAGSAVWLVGGIIGVN